ncbi:MAG: L-histidine N(alpha)-methyltransferase [Bacteroidia bacterium]|nr:L-histidine N(alpha)-methyltransferase [Bacteroidia bacterium]
MQNFKQDVIDLFTYARGGHVDHWLFSDTLRNKMTGSELWHAFLKACKAYYVLDNEIKIIRQNKHHFGRIFEDVNTLVDLGVGEIAAIENKVIPLLRELRNVRTYQGVDLSSDFLQVAENRLKSKFPALNVENVHADFYKHKIQFEGQKRLGLMLGLTITNQEMKEGQKFPRDEFIQRLGIHRKNIGNDNDMLISHDANANIAQVMASYRNKFWARHVTGIMYDVQKIADGDFSAKDWMYKAVWNADAHVIHQCAVATRSQDFEIDEQVFSVKSGQRFVTVNNFKIPRRQFTGLCHDAGFRVKKGYGDNGNKVFIQHLVA